MDEMDRVKLLAELENDSCELNHGPNTRSDDYQAVNYLVIPIGYKKNKVEDVAVRELIVPVCLECAEALIQDEWTLLFCLDCTANRWICRELAKNSYRHHILWLKGCPDCTNTFGGLYFTDQQEMENNPYLMDKEKVIETV